MKEMIFFYQIYVMRDREGLERACSEEGKTKGNEGEIFMFSIFLDN